MLLAGTTRLPSCASNRCFIASLGVAAGVQRWPVFSSHRPLSTSPSSSTSSPSSSTSSSTAILDEYGLKVQKTLGLSLRRLSNGGRGLFTLSPVAAGSVVLRDLTPLAYAADPEQVEECCSHCLRALPLQGKGSNSNNNSSSSNSNSNATSCACGRRYCNSSCLSAARASGHDAVCGTGGGGKRLDAFCKEFRVNFPRMAATAAARSVSQEVDFSSYWSSLNRLSTVTLPSPDAYPPIWKTGYNLSSSALRENMSGESVGVFFDVVFDQRTYARLMGALRLNSFSVPCPIDAPARGGSRKAAAGAGSSDGATSSAGVRAAGARAAAITVAAANGGQESTPSATTANSANGGGGGGCCSDDGSPGGAGAASSSSSSCSTESNCSTSGADSLSSGDISGGGTALYEYASLINHDCDPNLDVEFGPCASLTLRARRPIPAGTELTITYLDSSLPLPERRKKLAHEYGFQCQCGLCMKQLEVMQKEAAIAARAEAAAAKQKEGE